MRYVGGVFASALALCAPALGQWTDVTPAAMQLQFEHTRSAAWGDYNNDGNIDLYIGIRDGVNRLYRNDGGGVFVDVTAPPLDAYGLTHQVMWGDANNDGFLDLYVCQVNNNVYLDRGHFFLNNGDSTFTDQTNGEPLELNTHTPRGGSWADYNADGMLDLFIGISAGASRDNRLMQNVDGVSFFEDELTSLIEPLGQTYAVAWCDFDNDGHQDVYINNGWDKAGAEPEAITSALYRNNGDGTFVNVAAGAGVADIGLGRGIAWGDYDNDGDFDLLVARLLATGVDGVNRLYRNNGDGTFTDMTFVAGITESQRTRSVAWVDVDNDGWIDLHVVNGGNGNNTDRLYMNQQDGTFVESAGGTPVAISADSHVASWCDFDRDGQMDVFVGTGTGQLAALIRNDHDNGNNWIEIELVGTISNRSAIGARVEILAGGVTQIREVQSGSGYMAQHMLPTHFGIGSATSVDAVSIRWPSGLTQSLTGFAANAYHTVIEPSETQPCESDLDLSGAVNGADLSVLLSAWGSSFSPADFTDDSLVNGADLAIMLTNWGPCFPVGGR